MSWFGSWLVVQKKNSGAVILEESLSPIIRLIGIHGILISWFYLLWRFDNAILFCFWQCSKDFGVLPCLRELWKCLSTYFSIQLQRIARSPIEAFLPWKWRPIRPSELKSEEQKIKPWLATYGEHNERSLFCFLYPDILAVIEIALCIEHCRLVDIA